MAGTRQEQRKERLRRGTRIYCTHARRLRLAAAVIIHENKEWAVGEVIKRIQPSAMIVRHGDALNRIATRARPAPGASRLKWHLLGAPAGVFLCFALGTQLDRFAAPAA